MHAKLGQPLVVSPKANVFTIINIIIINEIKQILKKLLENINSKYGKYAILGNHDYQKEKNRKTEDFQTGNY